MILRGILLLAALVPAVAVMAQEHEYYPYETESEERTPVLLTDSVLFYRAVQTSDDLYGAVTDYNLSFVRVQRRGVGSDLRTACADGLEVPPRYFGALRALGAVESGYAGLQMAGTAVGSVNGIRLFRFNEGEPLPGGRTSVTFADRNYLAGAKFSYAAPLGRGWSLWAAADARTGRDLHVKGVFTNSFAASVRAVRQFRGGHTLALTAVVPPSMRGVRSSSVEEAFALTGDCLYNPAWGFQSGRVRNARIRREFLPMAMAAGTFLLSEATQFAVSLGAVAGVSKYSSLGWYDAATPLPDNYRYLPSYAGDRETEEAWRGGDPRYTQIDWDELYARNRMTAGDALYAQEDRVESSCELQFGAFFTTRFDDRLTLRYGIAADYASVRNYKQMRDLLGAEFLLDIDHYMIDDDTYGNRLQNDLQHPNRRVGVGDRFGYDYALRRRRAGVRVAVEYRADRFRADVGGEVGDAAVFRRGYFEKELFAGDLSYGRSAVLEFTPYVFKAAAGWAFSPRTYLGVAAAISASVPESDDLFLQPQYNNRPVDGAALKKLWSAELVFSRTGRILDLRATAFATLMRDGMAAYRYYDDLSGVFCDMSVTGIGMRMLGVEAAANVRLGFRWRLSLAASAGSYIYASDPRVTVVADTDNAPVDLNAVSRMGGCRAGNAPQVTANAEASYFGSRGWGFRAGVNYAGLRYAEPAFLRRTARVTQQAAVTPEAFDAFTAQERLRDAFTLDASAFKSFRFGHSSLTVSLMLRNILNRRDMVYAAYESQRVRRSRSGDRYFYAPSETRRTYAYPRTFYLTVSYRF